MLDELGAVAQQGPEHAHLIVWPEGALQQPKRMQLLQPLRIVVIGFATRNDFEMARIDQMTRTAASSNS